MTNWILPRLGAHRLDRLQREHLDAFYLWLAEQGLAQNTILQIHRILSRALKVAVMRGRVARNVATLVDAPSAVEIELTPLDAAEARAVLAAATGMRNGARWSVALAAGLRQSEALGLRWEYVDLRSQWLCTPACCRSAAHLPDHAGGPIGRITPIDGRAARVAMCLGPTARVSGSEVSSRNTESVTHCTSSRRQTGGCGGGATCRRRV